MTSEMNTKVRLVRCPKCKLVLPELPEIPVYKCGGCNIVLQAKNQNHDTKETRFEYAKSDENGLKDEDNINMKQFECKDSSTDNSISCQDIVQLGNHVLGDENSSWDRGIRAFDDDSIELTSIDIDVVSSLDDDTDHWTETDGIVSDNVKMGCSKDSSFYNDMLDSSSPESGLNKRKGKSVKLSREYRAGSKIGYQGKRGADELFKDWTFKGLRAEQSYSNDVNIPGYKPEFEHGVTRVDISKSSSSKPPRRMCCNESGVLNSLSSKIEMHCHGYNRPGFYNPVNLFQDSNSLVVQRNNLSACSYHNSGLCSPDTPLYNEPNKSELLKMINELKDEIKRTRISNIRLSRDYMSHEPRVSRMSRLSEPPDYGHYSFYSNQTLYKGSCSSTPSHHNQHVVKESSSSKRYMRPTAGGNPFLTCYHCSELLQMPVDFIIPGRRRHKLRCNACSKTMEFSISGKGHLTPCIIDAVAPPPSMVDDYSDSRSDTREARVRVDTSKLSPRSRSEAALHRLMGYSSISQVIRPRKQHK